MGATGVVGGNLPLALGDVLAARLGGTDRVAVVFFGDGAVQAGHFHETVNLAALWELPLIFVCENNGFAEFTPRSAHTVIERVSDVVAPYGFARETVDGSDAEAVWEAFAQFLSGARDGQGPMLLECLTHRRRGHYEGDAERYRERLEDEEWRRRDPVARLAQDRRFGEREVERLRRSAAEQVDRAVEFARASAFPDLKLAPELVYAR
jgi:pyruvate dehydrogenase E1 component alpha subunit